jgi:hypothetical protein
MEDRVIEPSLPGEGRPVEQGLPKDARSCYVLTVKNNAASHFREHYSVTYQVITHRYV